jgi:membrane-associated protease RseP (regulator of RpoE activity)
MILQIIYIILALLAIGILIFIHELGHFWVGRKVGMRVKKFSIGFGPTIKKWRKNDVLAVMLASFRRICSICRNGK